MWACGERRYGCGRVAREDTAVGVWRKEIRLWACGERRYDCGRVAREDTAVGLVQSSGEKRFGALAALRGK